MVNYAIYFCLGTLFVLTSMHAQGMDINVHKEDYEQIVDAENGNQINLKEKIDTPAKKAINMTCSVLPSLNRGTVYWACAGVLYLCSLGLTIGLTYMANNNNPNDYSSAGYKTDWCVYNMQPITCCPQGQKFWDCFQCLSTIPPICLK